MSLSVRVIFIYSVAGFILFLALCSIEPFNSIMDDAYISLIYARNLARGGGLTYAGGFRVEGYSNFIWTLLCSFYYLMPGSVFVWLRLGSLLCVFLTFCYLVRLSFQEDCHPWYIVVAPLLFLSMDTGFVVYAKSGMETPLHALLIVLCVYYYSPVKKSLTNAFGFSALLALLFCVRPEGGIFLIVFAAHQILSSCRSSRSWPWAFTWFGLTLGLISIFLAWRYLYYGDILPNTYYAKVDVSSVAQKSRGLRYVLAYLLYYLPLPVLLLAVGGAAAGWRCSVTVQLCVLVCTAQAVFAVAAGGDFFPHARFFAPVAPMVYFLASRGAAHFLRGAQKRPLPLATFITAAIILLSLLMMPLSRRYLWTDRGAFATATPRGALSRYLARRLDWIVRPHIPQPEQKIGTFLADHYAADTVIATGQAGQIPYYSGMKTIDLCGLNNSVIARNGPRASHLLASDVDIVIMKIPPRRRESLFPQLIREYAFQKHYGLARIISGNNASWGKAFFVMWQRKEDPDERFTYQRDIQKMFRRLAAQPHKSLRL